MAVPVPAEITVLLILMAFSVPPVVIVPPVSERPFEMIVLLAPCVMFGITMFAPVQLIMPVEVVVIFPAALRFQP